MDDLASGNDARRNSLFFSSRTDMNPNCPGEHVTLISRFGAPIKKAAIQVADSGPTIQSFILQKY